MSEEATAPTAMVAAEATAEATKEALDAAGEAPRRLIASQMEAGAEWLAFASRRLQAQAGLLSALGECRDLTAFARAQSRFWDQAARDYSGEAARLSDMTQRTLARFAAPAPFNGE